MADIVICDANILIDLVSAEKGELFVKALISYFGKIIVPSFVIQEVHSITLQQAIEYGLVIEDVPIEYIYSDYSDMPEGLSFPDKIILKYVREKKWDCITNDKLLRTWCKKEGVNVYWGLQAIIILVREHLVAKEDAIRLGEDIHKYNKSITRDILSTFISEVRACK